ncbi:MAG: putative metal-binding motif-containing protein [Myxococcota bacterium]
MAPDALDFGVVAVGDEPMREVTLTNGGGTEVSLLSVTLTEGDPDLWRADHDEDVVPAQGEITVSVWYSPEVPGERSSGRIQIRTDADPASAYVALVGVAGPSNADDDGDGYSVADGDCNDGDPDVHPGAAERCNGVDDDCNGITPGDEADDDGDGWRVCGGDCDDTQGAVHPQHPEECDGLDNDCDPSTDEDVDGDLDGYTICTGDCDDAEPRANPGRAEVCDGVDNDCNGGADDLDLDGDGHSLCSAGGDCDDDDPNAYPVLVDPSGSATGTGTEADPYDTVATALQHLDAVCREVVFTPGDHYGVAVDWTGGTVLLRGETGDPAEVVLHAAKGARHLTISGGDVTVRDLTLTGGDAGGDGGSMRVQSASLTLDHAVVSQNAAAADGGAVAALSSSTVRVRGGTRFEANQAGDEGGALAIVASALVDDDSVYEGNAGAIGGALFVSGGDADVDQAEFRGNYASVEGGGVVLLNAGTYSLAHNWLAANTTDGDGGGVLLRNVDDAGAGLHNNRVQDNTAAATGGGIAALGTVAAVRIANNTLTGNTSTGEGGGVEVALVNGAGFELLSNVLHSNDGASGIHAAAPGAFVGWNTGYLNNAGHDFAGDLVDGGGAPLDPTNVVRDPQLVAMSDNDNPDDDDLTLQAGSDEIDDGPPFAELDDGDGSQNDRGFTGGP